MPNEQKSHWKGRSMWSGELFVTDIVEEGQENLLHSLWPCESLSFILRRCSEFKFYPLLHLNSFDPEFSCFPLTLRFLLWFGEYLLFLVFIGLFASWDRAIPCSPGWSLVLNPPASVSLVLGLQGDNHYPKLLAYLFGLSLLDLFRRRVIHKKNVINIFFL